MEADESLIEPGHGLHSNALALLAVYLTVFLLGWRANRRVVARWARANIGLLHGDFAAIGIEPAPERQVLLEGDLLDPCSSGIARMESARRYKIYATGRRFCRGLLVELDLRPRQDLLALVYSMLSSWEDVLSMDIPMNHADMGPFVFAVLPASEVFDLAKKLPDVAVFARPVPLELLPRRFACFTDCSELVTALLTPDVVHLLAELEHYLEYIHVSDQHTKSGFGPNYVPAKSVRLRFRLPPHSSQRSALCLRLALRLADLAGQVSLSAGSYRSAKSARASVRRRFRGPGGPKYPFGQPSTYAPQDEELTLSGNSPELPNSE
mmetsp:Transcript_13905/g.44512  ORF Transcript_13905/g.44512 Transcript_13905/m.44512 type:complete len:323 (+) Transcript_13905:88-1056(+)